MASDQPFWTLPADSDLPEFQGEDLMNLLGMPSTHEPPTQTPLTDSAQQSQDSDLTYESTQTQPQLSISQFSLDPGDFASLSPRSMIPIADSRQTHHVDLEPAEGSRLQQPEPLQGTDQMQSLNTALTTVSVIHKGKRVLKPCINIIPIRLVEMLTQQ